MVATIQNTGGVEGKEVVQLYIDFPSSAQEPQHQLRGFKKTISMKQWQSTTVTFKLSQQDLSIWNISTHDWSLVKGEFIVYVSASSRDIRLSGSFLV